MSTLIHSALLLGDTLAPGWVRFDETGITQVGEGAPPSPEPGEEVIDARAYADENAVLAPGFVDIHAHGGGGYAFDDGLDAIRGAVSAHAAHGTTRSVLSLVSAPIDVLADRVATVADAVDRVPGVAGSHLEGPFLDPGHKGAHDPGALRAPDPDDIDLLLNAGRGTIRQITLAPELSGADAAIARFVRAGVRVAVGHTDADMARARLAFANGATVLTHAFNAMAGLHHRAPGPVGASVADDRVTLEVIADGVHVDPILVRMLFASAPGRVALVTDAMAAAASADGDYRLGSLDVEVRAGIARLAGTETIAGSTLTMDRAVRTAVAAGVPLAAALRAATSVPAAAVGLTRSGNLRRGGASDLVLLDSTLRVRGVWRDGAQLA